MAGDKRIPIGIWAQWPPGARWTNEGMTRLVGFLIEGIAKSDQFMFTLVLPDWIRDEAAEDMAGLDAVEGRDYSLVSPRDFNEQANDVPALAAFANAHADVAGWISIFPNFDGGRDLDKPLAVIFPDAIPKVFHEFSDAAWGPEGAHSEWARKIRSLAEAAGRFVTFSNHVRDQQLGPLFGIAADKVAVVPHAQPDLASALPFFDGERTPDTRRKAAEMLRAHASERGWDYLRNYPFEHSPYIAVSTQDRVTKNIRTIADAVTRLVREERCDLKILSTAPLHFGATWTPLPAFLETEQAHRDLISIPDLPRAEHAAFYHCAEMAVHASVFEGGHTPFPFSEAVSVGTPCLMAMGPHVREFADANPAILPFTFDPYDPAGLARLIRHQLGNRDAALAVQQAMFQRLKGRTWTDVAEGYARAALEAGE